MGLIYRKGHFEVLKGYLNTCILFVVLILVMNYFKVVEFECNLQRSKIIMPH